MFVFNNNSKNQTTDFCVFLILPNLQNIENNISKIAKNFQSDFETANETFSLVISNSNKTILKRNTKDSMNMFLEKLAIHLKNPLQIWDIVEQIIITQLSQQIITKQYGFDPSRTFSGYRLCAKRVIQENRTKDFSNQNSKDSPLSIIDNHHQGNNVVRWIAIQQNGSVLTSKSTCLSYHLNSDCKTEKIEKNYTLNEDNTLKLKTYDKKNILLNENQYLPTTTGYLICVTENLFEQVHIYTWLKTVEKIEAYISTISTFVSIIFELIAIFLFSLLRKLQNRGGLNLLGMIFFLFASDVLFITSNKFFHSTIQSCKWIAVMLHWTLLTLSMWGIIVSYDLSRDIMGTGSNQVALKPFKKFSVMMSRTAVSFIGPTFIVAMSIALNELELFHVSYGYTDICWINSFHALIAFYIVPVVFSYVFSFVCLLLILKHIMKERKFIQKNSKGNIKQKGSTIKIAIKIIVILGITEMFGMIQIPKKSPTKEVLMFNSVFTMLFALSRSLRGCLIFLVHFVNKRILRMAKEKLFENDPA